MLRLVQLWNLLPLLLLATAGAAQPPVDSTDPVDEKDRSRPNVQARGESQQLIRDLSADDFRTRLNASRKLTLLGAEAFPELTTAARTGDPETLLRVTQILRRAYPDNSTLGEAASESLEELALSRNPSVATAAIEALEEHSELRDQRALAQIRRFGGIIKYHTAIGGADAAAIAYIILDASWKGGDEGVKYLARLSTLQTIYVINGTEVSQTALDRLYDTFPGLRLQHRGTGYLGIASDRNPNVGNGCLVTKVEPNSAAQDAGILAEDIIKRFDGTEIDNFDHLIKEIMKKNGGDEVIVEVDRRGIPLKLKCTLGTWRAGG